ncbi:MAG: 2-C-methyl-D-erythritol 2,4-cyclodiphosphate synthase [Luminiphilus sp.]|nr:2-C-methyl-D-erythritol 2,4-cyclodiphosphate synthase [Luminiphilus sp.]MDG1461256.1 2-C-methyl-D-erythritol 2,4-cyclodiphosphate synthase [Luminiphilus sp.]
MRIGHGFDVHAFGPGDHVILGGEKISHTAGLIAHSDGDVVLHAVCDALLGAAGLGDIGKHFPDTDASYADADSRGLLRQVAALLDSQQWQAINVDITIVAQQPKVAPHTEAMQAHIASDLGLEPQAINVKATTTEKLGYIGREEGIACHAVVLLAAQADKEA